MKLVVDKQLPISLSSKADFSDYVDRKGVSHPRYATWDGEFADCAGVQGTDLLIVDDAQLPALAADWKKVAAKLMRNANIVAHERASFKLKAI